MEGFQVFIVQPRVRFCRLVGGQSLGLAGSLWGLFWIIWVGVRVTAP